MSDDRPGAVPPSAARRRILARVTVALGSVIAGVIALPPLALLVAPLLRLPEHPFSDVGPVGQYPPGETVLAAYRDPTAAPWAGETARAVVWVQRLGTAEERRFRVFAENCTHLGCPISWRRDSRLFFCPCHGGAFYEDGSVAAGPPLQPLFEREWKVEGDRLLIKAGPLPSIRNRTG